jgi:Ku70/Ku80 N-terminal alpha/beta domain.
MLFIADISVFVLLCLKLLNLVFVSHFTLNSKRILLFTNTDNPHAGSQHKQHQARIKAADLGQLDIDVELLHMGSTFDPSLFYKVREYISTVLILYMFHETDIHK